MDRLLGVQNDLIAEPVEEQELWKFLDMLERETLLDIDCIHRTVYPRFKIIYKILNNAKKGTITIAARSCGGSCIACGVRYHPIHLRLLMIIRVKLSKNLDYIPLH